jgi:hypothetical protein
MPAGDRTGPWGMGPMSGRGAGHCAGYGMLGYAHRMPGRGPSIGWGRRRAWGGAGCGPGWRHWYHATGLPGWARFGYGPPWGFPEAEAYPASPPYAARPAPEQEIEFLRGEAEWLGERLEAITRRIEELEQEM